LPKGLGKEISYGLAQKVWLTTNHKSETKVKAAKKSLDGCFNEVKVGPIPSTHNRTITKALRAHCCTAKKFWKFFIGTYEENNIY